MILNFRSLLALTPFLPFRAFKNTFYNFTFITRTLPVYSSSSYLDSHSSEVEKSNAHHISNICPLPNRKELKDLLYCSANVIHIASLLISVFPIESAKTVTLFLIILLLYLLLYFCFENHK